MENRHHVTKKNVAYKQRQGNGWVVSYYSPSYDSWVVSGEKDYWSACALVKECREDWNTKAQNYNTEIDEVSN